MPNCFQTRHNQTVYRNQSAAVAAAMGQHSGRAICAYQLTKWCLIFAFLLFPSLAGSFLCYFHYPHPSRSTDRKEPLIDPRKWVRDERLKVMCSASRPRMCTSSFLSANIIVSRSSFIISGAYSVKVIWSSLWLQTKDGSKLIRA